MEKAECMTFTKTMKNVMTGKVLASLRIRPKLTVIETRTAPSSMVETTGK